MARREGSPWTGVNVIARKVFADHLTSLRLGVLEGLVFMAAVAAVYGASEVLRQTVAESPYVFLHLFTATREPLPSLSEFLGFFVPLVAIGLGFDAVNAELVRGTLSRVLAQPVYRDAFLAGKFLGTLAILFLLLVTLWVLTVGLGIWFLGVPPDGEEMIRLGCFWLVTLLYAGVWLALAVLVSVLITQPASAALVALGIWLFVWLFWPLVAQTLSEIPGFVPGSAALPIDTHAMRQGLERLAPTVLYAEAVQPLLVPEMRAIGRVFSSQLEGAVLGNPLPVAQSISMVGPRAAGLLATVLLLMSTSYVIFQRQEIRA
ncbi:MAG: ABC transporter permease [Pseudomonadota bacterium]|nr:ABC transporter permease [Pseudomonadota bacterium]